MQATSTSDVQPGAAELESHPAEPHTSRKQRPGGKQAARTSFQEPISMPTVCGS